MTTSLSQYAELIVQNLVRLVVAQIVQMELQLTLLWGAALQYRKQLLMLQVNKRNRASGEIGGRGGARKREGEREGGREGGRERVQAGNFYQVGMAIKWPLMVIK